METKPLFTIRLELDLAPTMAKLVKALTSRTETKNAPTVKEQVAEPVVTEEASAPEDEPKIENLTILGDKTPAVEVETKTYPSKQDVRECMDSKIEELAVKDGERDEKVYKELKKAFKSISARLGADKPSELPEEQREAFITEASNLAIADGTIAPF